MNIRHNVFKSILTKSIASLPLRKELSAVKHFIGKDTRKVRIGLDLGFTQAGVSQMFRQLGGYWLTAEFTKERGDLVAAVLGEDKVVVLGSQGQIPFEEKQFDTIVVANRGVFFDGVPLEMLIKECHRVLINGGLFVFTFPRRKAVALARLLGGRRGKIEAQYACTYKEVLSLLKPGFDVLGIKYSGRFWIELVRQFMEQNEFSGKCSVPEWLERSLYGFASFLDLPLFFTGHYNITVCGRRKGWRGQQRALTNDQTAAVSNALFYDYKRSRKTFSATRFK